MKLKISWPTGIVIAIVAFMVFILSFVYKVTFMDDYDHHLVSEDYYNDELNYQQEIDKLNNAIALDENVKLVHFKDGIQIVFPKEFEPVGISGTIEFKRLSNNKIDFKFPIELVENTLLIKDEQLVKGLWNVRVEWEFEGNHYLLKEKINY